MNEIENILNEITIQVKEFRNDYISNEQAVRTQLIEPILNILGWRTSNPKFVRPNAPSDDGKIPDYTLIKNQKTTLIVEAKNLSIDLKEKKIIDQLASYCYKMGINFGILTNGIKWLLFKTFENNPIDRIIWEIDIENDKIDTVERSLNSFSYSNIDVLESLIKKSKALDNAWKNLDLSIDSITEIISQKISEKIKSLEPGLKIDITDINKYSKSKIFEIFDIIENQIEDNSQKEIIDAESEDSDIKDSILGKYQKNKIREKVSVVFPDNTVIKYNKVVDTFIETIKKIGPEKIQQLKISRSGIPIVSDTKDIFYNQHQIGRFWIMVHTSTKEKVAILNEINYKLKLNLKIETFTNK